MSQNLAGVEVQMHHHHHHYRRTHSFAPGLLLISVGGGLLLREFGYLPSTVRFIDFWPLLLVSVGLSGTFQNCGVLRRLVSLGVATLGAFLLAGNLGYLTFPAARLWPVLLVLLGVSFLFRRPRGGPPWQGRGRRFGPSFDGSAPTEGHRYRHPEHWEERVSENRLSRAVTLSGAQIRVDSQAWQGGELTATFAGVELDLRNAKLAEQGATLEVRAVMGGIEIRVPDNWLVSCDVHPMLGGVDNDTRVPKGDPNPPALHIVGSLTLGGLNVRS